MAPTIQHLATSLFWFRAPMRCADQEYVSYTTVEAMTWKCDGTQEDGFILKSPCFCPSCVLMLTRIQSGQTHNLGSCTSLLALQDLHQCAAHARNVSQKSHGSTVHTQEFKHAATAASCFPEFRFPCSGPFARGNFTYTLDVQRTPPGGALLHFPCFPIGGRSAKFSIGTDHPYSVHLSATHHYRCRPILQT